MLLSVNELILLKSSPSQELVPWASENEDTVFISSLSDVRITGSEMLRILVVISYFDDQCDVVFIELAKFCVGKGDIVPLSFSVPKRVIRPEDSMTVIDVNNLETVFLVSDGR